MLIDMINKSVLINMCLFLIHKTAPLRHLNVNHEICFKVLKNRRVFSNIFCFFKILEEYKDRKNTKASTEAAKNIVY